MEPRKQLTERDWAPKRSAASSHDHHGILAAVPGWQPLALALALTLALTRCWQSRPDGAQTSTGPPTLGQLTADLTKEQRVEAEKRKVKRDTRVPDECVLLRMNPEDESCGSMCRRCLTKTGSATSATAFQIYWRSGERPTI